MTQILLFIVWVIAVIAFFVINFLVRRQLKGVIALRPFARLMYYVEFLVGVFFLLLVLFFIMGLGSTTPVQSGGFIY